MSLLSKQIDPNDLPNHNKILAIPSPLSGIVMPLNEVPHPLFQQRMFGEGVAIKPSGFQIVAPFAGIISSFPELANQIRLKAKNGLLLQIQLGIDSHLMMGEGFKRHKLEGDTFAKGDILGEFSLTKMKQTLPSILCPITIINSEKIVGIQGHYYSVIAEEDVIMSVFI